jgi:FKBP-type peptidyl-prolyl cis-trans isomerase
MNIRPSLSPATLTPFSRTTLAVLLIAALGAAGACGDDSPSAPTQLPRAEYSQTDLRVGTGTEATNGRRLTVHYTLWLYDPAGANGKGRQLQSSVGFTPYSFVLGVREVISGWDRGVPGMLVGGQRRLTLPPELAYGASGSGSDIPPYQSLVFEIELLNVQ